MQRTPSAGEADFAGILTGRCSVITSGTLVCRRRVIEAGMFDEKLSSNAEDFDLWLRLARRGAKINYQKQVLLKYRVRPESLSGSSVQRARRTVEALRAAGEKFDLTDAEAAVLRRTIEHAEAELLLETGKAHLLREEFADARRNFRAANQYYRKTKLKLIDLALAISPKMLVRLFKRQRARELPFIPTSEL